MTDPVAITADGCAANASNPTCPIVATCSRLVGVFIGAYRFVVEYPEPSIDGNELVFKNFPENFVIEGLPIDSNGLLVRKEGAHINEISITSKTTKSKADQLHGSQLTPSGTIIGRRFSQLVAAMSSCSCCDANSR